MPDASSQNICNLGDLDTATLRIEDLPRGVPVVLNGGSIIIRRPRLHEERPVPNCDFLVEKWDDSIGILLTLFAGDKAIRLENVPKSERPFFTRWGFKPVGPLCDRIMFRDADNRL